MKEPVGYTGVDLNAVFSCIWREETNIANYLADLVNYLAKSNVTIINSGSLRIDEIIPEGVITIKEMRKLLPAQLPMVTLQGTGAQLLKLLENGVSKVPGFEGWFPCVAGVRFKFNPHLPEHGWIDPNDVTVESIPLDLEKLYTITTTEYLATGKDGYDEFKNMKMIRDEE